MDVHNRKNLLEKYLEADIVLDEKQKQLCNDNRIENYFLGKVDEHNLFSIKAITGDFYQHILGMHRRKSPHTELWRALQYRFVALFKRYTKYGLIEKYNRYQYQKCKDHVRK